MNLFGTDLRTLVIFLALLPAEGVEAYLKYYTFSKYSERETLTGAVGTLLRAEERDATLFVRLTGMIAKFAFVVALKNSVLLGGKFVGTRKCRDIYRRGNRWAVR